MKDENLNCVYHPIHKMRVVNDFEKDQLLATGEWFDHPTKAMEAKGNKHEQLQQKPRLHTARRQRGANLKQSSKDGTESA